MAVRALQSHLGAADDDRDAGRVPEVQEPLLEPAPPASGQGEVMSITFYGHVYTVTTEAELIALVSILNRQAA